MFAKFEASCRIHWQTQTVGSSSGSAAAAGAAAAAALLKGFLLAQAPSACCRMHTWMGAKRARSFSRMRSAWPDDVCNALCLCK